MKQIIISNNLNNRIKVLLFSLILVFNSCSTKELELVSSTKRVDKNTSDDELEDTRFFIKKEGYWGGVKITYKELDNGVCLFEDDIELDSNEISSKLSDFVMDAATTTIPKGKQRKGVALKSSKWLNNKIPYRLHKSLSKAQKELIKEAVAVWNKEVSNVKYVKVNSKNVPKDYVAFKRVKGKCSSKLGRKGGIQYIKIAAKCKKGSLLHEMMHAAGVLHEHTRSDRDKYITIYKENIKKEKYFNFKKPFERGYKTVNVGPFDFNSLMMYSSSAFIKNKEKEDGFLLYPAFLDKEGNEVKGQRKRFSKGDIQILNKKYKTKSKRKNGQPIEEFVNNRTYMLGNTWVLRKNDKWYFNYENTLKEVWFHKGISKWVLENKGF